MENLEENHNWYLIKQKNRSEDRILKKLNFTGAYNDSCEEIDIDLHDGYRLNVTADGMINEDGSLTLWLELVGEEVEEKLKQIHEG